MKLKLLALALLGCMAFSTNSTVYICVSKTAHKYHFDKDCRGLNRCTHTIEKVSIAKAKELGYTICGYED